MMKSVIKYRGRHVNAEDIGFIKELISKNPAIGRCELSRQICQEWNWVQSNGHLRDMVCRGLLLELERNGYIVLPPRKSTPINPFLKPKEPKKIELDQSPIKTTLKEILPLTFVQVRRTPLEKLFNSLICYHHYLGYTQPVGEHLKYLVPGTWYFQFPGKDRLPVLPGPQQYVILAVEIVLSAGTKKHEPRISTCLPITPVFPFFDT